MVTVLYGEPLIFSIGVLSVPYTAPTPTGACFYPWPDWVPQSRLGHFDSDRPALAYARD